MIYVYVPALGHMVTQKFDRWEGVVSRPLSASTLTPVAVTRWFEQYDVTSVDTLRIRWPPVAASSICLMATDLRFPPINFRMTVAAHCDACSCA